MNTYLYIILIIGLTIFVLLYGGHNQQSIVEYNSEYFDNLNTIIIFEKKLNKNIDNIIFDSSNFININKFLDTSNILIPNFINCFYVQIKPYTLFNINNLVNKEEMQTSMMIMFNHKKHNNLELLIDDSTNYLYKKNLNLNLMHTGYFYDLEKIISITSIYHIYNNSSENIIVTCFILKKPFWHK